MVTPLLKIYNMLKKLSVSMDDVWMYYGKSFDLLEASDLLKSKMTVGTCSIITAVLKKRVDHVDLAGTLTK